MLDAGAAAGKRLTSVEGLRAIAALAVFAFHLTWRSPALRYGHGAAFTGHLDTGVEVFFVLSGFLIFSPFAKALVERAHLPATVPYVARRFIRIWPAYAVALWFAVQVGVADIVGWRGLVKHGTLTYLYFDDRGGDSLPVAWTLVVELSFYALVPVLAHLLPALRSRLVEVSVGLVLLGAWYQHVVAYDLETRPSVRVLPPALLSLGLGMLLASVRAQGDATGRLGRALRAAAARPLIPLLTALAAFVVMVLGIKAGTDLRVRADDRFAKELLQAVVAFGLALPVLLGGGTPGRWRRVLATPALAYLGTISYGIYLWHLPVLRKCRGLLVSPHPYVAVLGWTVALTATLALAAASWHLIERPLMEAVRRRLTARGAGRDRLAGSGRH